MIRAGVSLSTALDPRAAAERASAEAMDALGGRPEAALVLASTAWGEPALRELVATAHGALACPASAGGAVHGLLARGADVERNPATLVLAIAGIEAEAVLLDRVRGEEPRAAEELASHLGEEPREEDLLLLLADCHAVDPGPLLRGVGRARAVGVGASEVGRGSALVWRRDEIVHEGVAGLVLRLPRPARLATTQGWRVVGGLHEVTAVRDRWIERLDGRRALDVLRELDPGPLEWDLRRVSRALLAGIEVGGRARGAREDAGDGAATSSDAGALMVRNLVGFDPSTGALAIPERVRRGSRLAFVALDREAARVDLERTAGRLGTGALALYFDSRARGAALFGRPGCETAVLEAALPGVPLAGAYGPVQLCLAGPGSGSGLHTHAGVLAVVGA